MKNPQQNLMKVCQSNNNRSAGANVVFKADMSSTLRKPFWLTLLSLPLLCLTAFADGKVFTTAVAAPVTTPDQRAMLQFSNGVERLVIETSFVGQGTNFAWVVPLPSVPKIEAVSTNFFGYLNA